MYVYTLVCMYELCTRVSACALMCVRTGLHEGRAMLSEVAPRGLVGGTLLLPHPRLAAPVGGNWSKREKPVRTPSLLCPEAATVSCGSNSFSVLSRISKSH